jgi:hypothetical protein
LTGIGLGGYLDQIESESLEAMKLVVTARVPQDDTFQIFYMQREDDKFDTGNSVKTRIKGDKAFQDIRFQLPEIDRLKRLRFDIGSNPEQDTIVIKQIKFIKENEELVFNQEEFNLLFEPNIYIKKVKNPGIFFGKTIPIKGRTVHDPYFVSIIGSEAFARIKSQKLTHYPYLISFFISLLLMLAMLTNLSRIKVTSQGLFITCFILMLLLPGMQKRLMLVPEGSNKEKRTLVEKPQLVLDAEYPRKFEAYFNDHFGLRNNLINWGGAFRTKLFRSSIHPELVQFGKNDWLFYNRIDGKIFGSYTNSNLLTQERLGKIIDKWESNKNSYESKGMKYFLAFWPNKHTIYPEYLPYTMAIQIKDTISRVDQVIRYLDKHGSDVQLLDVRPELKEAKKRHPMYHRFDTHWNNYGAFIAYQEFFKEYGPELGIVPKKIDDFDIQWEAYDEGELIDMLGINNKGYFSELNPTFTLKQNKDQIEFLSTEGFPAQTKITRNAHCGNKLKVLVFRDSFFTKLIPFFSLHFYEVIYIWGHGERYVDELKPDIVIEGYVERGAANKIQ